MRISVRGMHVTVSLSMRRRAAAQQDVGRHDGLSFTRRVRRVRLGTRTHPRGSYGTPSVPALREYQAKVLHETGPRQPTNYLLDHFVAHKLSELTACSALELPEEAKWLNTFILKTIFQFSITPKARAYLFNFLRRAEGASAAYREARRLLLEHLGTPRNVVSPYFLSLTQFKICVFQCYQGYELLARATGQQLYEPGQGTTEEKLQIVYVDSKHMDRMINSDKLPDPATSGIWITNPGIESSRGAISFQELHDLLTGMHRLAEKLCTIEPPSARAHQ
jgi:hypothetical protein